MIRLDKIRTSDNGLNLNNKISNTLLICFLGIVLGYISKRLDCMGIEDTIWWQHIIGVLDLNNFFSDIQVWMFLGIVISFYSKTPLRAALNVFLFFLGMTTCYHLCSIHYCGFNPLGYMKGWYLVTCLSPIPAIVCWYAGGKHPVCTIIKILITLCMFFACVIPFFITHNSRNLLEFLLFIVLLFLLYKDTIFRRKNE